MTCWIQCASDRLAMPRVARMHHTHCKAQQHVEGAEELALCAASLVIDSWKWKVGLVVESLERCTWMGWRHLEV
jgi:hypothetical protein